MSDLAPSSGRSRSAISYIVEVTVVSIVASSYPLYITCNALPRVAEVGPPVSDRYPWLFVAGVVAVLGARCRSVPWCFVYFAILMLGLLFAYADDDALVTGVLTPWRPVVPIAGAMLAVGHLARRLTLALVRRRNKAAP